MQELESKKDECQSLYSERSGVGTREKVEQLLAPPLYELDDNEKQLVYEFENSIADTVLEGGKTIEQAIMSQRQAGDLVPLVRASDYDDLRVSWHQDDDMSASDKLAMAKRSQEKFDNDMVRSLIVKTRPNSEVRMRGICIDALGLIEQSKLASSSRNILLHMRSNLAGSIDRIDQAKRAIVEVYLAKVNDLIARNIPMLDSLLDQAVLDDDSELISSIRSVTPRINKTTKESLFRRLDFLRNGAAYLSSDSGEGVSAIAGEIYETFEGDEVESQTNPNARFTGEQVAILRKTMLNTATVRSIVAGMLDANGLLSEYGDATLADVGREGRAPDGKFQVLVGSKGTIAVDGQRGLFKIPDKPLSLYQVIMTIGAHEAEHVTQSQNDMSMAHTLRIAKMQGKRVAALREAGANFKEREFEHELTGTSKPYANTYAKALVALELGGDLYDAIEAFYNEKRLVNPTQPRESTAREAANRVMRLIMYGGWNSQSMAYVEEGILRTELKDADRKYQDRATSVTCLSIDDQLKLHQFGLLPVVDGIRYDWTDKVMQLVRPYIESAINEDVR